MLPEFIRREAKEQNVTNEVRARFYRALEELAQSFRGLSTQDQKEGLFALHTAISKVFSG